MIFNEAIQETTGQVDDFFYQPHIYFINSGGKLVAYIRAGTTDVVEFSKPGFFDKRYRKFKNVTNQYAHLKDN
jgi:hypothetical protein